MGRKHTRTVRSLQQLFPPSEPCSCEVCVQFCRRPGWWTVDEAAAAVRAGMAERMMLELSPDRSFGVLSPAFRGCECLYAVQEYSKYGCTFLADGRCELHGSGKMPLECRYCHHDRASLGDACHAALEKDWNTPAGQVLVERWQRITGFWKRGINIRMRNSLDRK